MELEEKQRLMRQRWLEETGVPGRNMWFIDKFCRAGRLADTDDPSYGTYPHGWRALGNEVGKALGNNTAKTRIEKTADNEPRRVAAGYRRLCPRNGEQTPILNCYRDHDRRARGRGRSDTVWEWGKYHTRTINGV